LRSAQALAQPKRAALPNASPRTPRRLARRLKRSPPNPQEASMRNFPRRALGAVFALALGLAPSLASADDSVLFSTTGVTPNVLLLMDNSGSMNHIVYHPAYDESVIPQCNHFNNNSNYLVEGSKLNNGAAGTTTITITGNANCVTDTHTLPYDNNASKDLSTGKRYTQYSGRYLNWLFSAAAAPYWPEIDDSGNGFPSSCVGGSAFGKYQRTRMNVAKQILKDVVCQVNLVGQVRFGIAAFREHDNSNNPNGGYVVEPVDIPTSNQQADLVSAIQSLDADTYTPLGEALFQIYTYFMGRQAADLPLGKDGTTKFPAYVYNTSSSQTGGNYDPSNAPPDPIEYSCQKNFVIIVTDGQPTRDSFYTSTPTDTAQGFSDFDKLIGDYNVDGEAEGTLFSVGGSTLYLDDVAKYMHENDFRPDFQNDQTLDVYTIGFSASPTANALLQKTAQVANGLFFATNDQDKLAQAIIDSLQDIIEKSQSFTAATVPASRTAAGEQIYVSLFTPSNKSPYWNGVLRSYRLTGDGRILASNGVCALDDPSVRCNTGNFMPTATHPPYWDAADAMPSPGARSLRVSNLVGAVPSMMSFRHVNQGGLLTAADLGVTFPPGAPYTGSIATDAEQLTDEIIANVRGCYFGTGASHTPACDVRPAVLSDIFHSNPVVVGKPGYGTGEPSFNAFKLAVTGRDRVIYAGSNGGFLHGFHAGDWQPAATPPAYDPGNGVELFGFMPWPTRQIIRHVPQDTGGRDFYGVDASPQATDAWIHQTPTQTTKAVNGSEWRTIVTGGLRQGGETYYALDVTDPAAVSCPAGTVGTGFPCYMWEFPAENGLAWIKDTIGETWGDSIIARIKLDVGGTIVERWVAIVTGGYHPSGDPNQHATYDEDATKGRSIWIVDLKTGQPIAHRSFQNSGDCDEDLEDQQLDERGLCYAIASTPAVFDVDADGYDDLVVVGDLGGNLWKWVLKDPGHDPVNTADPMSDNDSLWPFRKFFFAPEYENSGNSFFKSFYFPPTATKENNVVWFAFGSGERNDLTYMSNAGTTDDNNRFFAIKDLDPLDQGGVLQPMIEGDTPDLLNLTSSSICADISAAKGYFIVGNEGEKWVTNVETLGGYLFAGSYIPTPSADPCLINGESFLYRFRITCGEPLNDGTPAAAVDPRAVDLGAGFPTDPRISVGPSGDADVIVSKQGGSIVTSGGGKVGGGTGYWREINN
jgi:type IV pilus assembly protein PilY1